MKICSKCGIEKVLGEFGKDKTKRNKIRLWCSGCVSITNKYYRETHKDYIKTYREAHKKEIKEVGKAYRQLYREELRDKKLQYRYGISFEELENKYQQ